MTKDACPLAVKLTPGLTLAQCYAYVGGQVRSVQCMRWERE